MRFVWSCNKIWFKSATGVGASKFAKKVDISGFKLENAPVDLSQSSKAVNNDVIKKTLYDALVKKYIATRLLILVI